MGLPLGTDALRAGGGVIAFARHPGFSSQSRSKTPAPIRIDFYIGSTSPYAQSALFCLGAGSGIPPAAAPSFRGADPRSYRSMGYPDRAVRAGHKPRAMHHTWLWRWWFRRGSNPGIMDYEPSPLPLRYGTIPPPVAAGGNTQIVCCDIQEPVPLCRSRYPLQDADTLWRDRPGSNRHLPFHEVRRSPTWLMSHRLTIAFELTRYVLTTVPYNRRAWLNPGGLSFHAVS